MQHGHLCRYVEERWQVSYSETGMLRLLWSLDLSHRKTRPRHPQSDEKAQQAFKKATARPGRATRRATRRPSKPSKKILCGWTVA